MERRGTGIELELGGDLPCSMSIFSFFGPPGEAEAPAALPLASCSDDEEDMLVMRGGKDSGINRQGVRVWEIVKRLFVTIVKPLRMTIVVGRISSLVKDL